MFGFLQGVMFVAVTCGLMEDVYVVAMDLAEDKMRSKATCHPEKDLRARGLCGATSRK